MVRSQLRGWMSDLGSCPSGQARTSVFVPSAFQVPGDPGVNMRVQPLTSVMGQTFGLSCEESFHYSLRGLDIV